MDTGQKTESLAQLVEDIEKQAVTLPEFQRDFVWDIEKTFDLFDSFVRDIFVGSLIYGVPSFEITVREVDRRPRGGKGSRTKLKLTSYSKQDIEKLVKIHGFRLLLDGQQRATSIFRALSGIDPLYYVALSDELMPPEVQVIPETKRTLEHILSEFRGEPLPGRVCIRPEAWNQAPVACAPSRRRSPKIAAVAPANKMARMIWAMMMTGEQYREPTAVAA